MRFWAVGVAIFLCSVALGNGDALPGELKESVDRFVEKLRSDDWAERKKAAQGLLGLVRKNLSHAKPLGRYLKHLLEKEKDAEVKKYLRMACELCPDVDISKALGLGVKWLLRNRKAGGFWDTKVAGFRVGVAGLALRALVGVVEIGGGDLDMKVGADDIVAVVKFLLKNADKQGFIGRQMGVDEWFYNHILATEALSELLVAAKSSESVRKLVPKRVLGEVREVMHRAVKKLLEAQNRGAGWRYGIRGGDSDTSLTSWAVLALRAAEKAGFKIPKTAYKGAQDWFNRCYNPNDGHYGYQSRFDRGAVIPGINDRYRRLPTMTAAALAALLSMDARVAGEEKSAALLMRSLPVYEEKEDPDHLAVDMYYWLRGTEAMRLYGGKEWLKWRKAVVSALTKMQRKDGCFPAVGKWGMVGGDAYSTATALLILLKVIK